MMCTETNTGRTFWTKSLGNRGRCHYQPPSAEVNRYPAEHKPSRWEDRRAIVRVENVNSHVGPEIARTLSRPVLVPPDPCPTLCRITNASPSRRVGPQDDASPRDIHMVLGRLHHVDMIFDRRFARRDHFTRLRLGLAI